LFDPDEWRDAADEPEPFEATPDDPDAWRYSCDEPDDTINPAQALTETDF
jgi:hypothetical protein